MERYLLFAWDGEPRGGFTDCLGHFVSLDAALVYKESFAKNHSYQIVDTKHMEVCKCGAGNYFKNNE